MARIKFLMFALPALGVWAWHLATTSIHAGELATQQAEHAAAAARPVFQARQAEGQLRLVRLMARGAAAWSTTPHAGNRYVLRSEALADAFAALRAALKTGSSDEVRSALVLGLASGDSILLSRGDGQASESLDGFNAKDALQAGLDGAIVDAFGIPHQFYALPLASWERGSTTLLVGSPLVSVDITSGVEKESGLAAVALVRGNKLLTSAGPQQEVLKKLAGAPPKGFLGVHEPVKKLGPLGLPWVGNEPPVLSVAVRSPLAGSDVEVMALASTEAQMGLLAESQELALFSFAGLMLLGIVMLVLLGGERAPGMSVVKPGARRTVSEVPAPVKSQGPEPLPVMEVPAPAEAHPDDFEFPAPGRAEPALGVGDLPSPPTPEPQGPEAFARQLRSMEQTRAEGYRTGNVDPGEPPEGSAWSAAGDEEAGFADAEPVPSNGAEGQETGPNPFEEAEQPTTVAYPAEYAPPPEGDENPDATRVAAVPAELIQQSAGMEAPPAWHEDIPDPVPPPSIPQPELGPEETHFQAVFREFVTTRERCGESADGLTYDRFAQKLRKNRDQLVQKYSCRTVRFQVYVKEGKAALKATPIRD
jgi:hypothetical protein